MHFCFLLKNISLDSLLPSFLSNTTKECPITFMGHCLKIAYILTLAQDRSRRRQWHPTPVLLPGKSHGWRSLVGCSPWGRWESDTTERLHFHFSLFMHWRRKWQPTPVFLPGESQGWGSLVGCQTSMGSHRVGHDWSDLAAAAAAARQI